MKKIQLLQQTYPFLYERFLQRFFIVRDWQHVYFSSIVGDLKLEQSINRFLNGQGQHICTRPSGDVSAVAEFGRLFHEILEIANLVNHVIRNKSMWHLETGTQRSLHGTNGIQFKKNIVQFIDAVNGKRNPCENIHDIQPPLPSVMTKTFLDEET